jgi:hypothetical protein
LIQYFTGDGHICCLSIFSRILEFCIGVCMSNDKRNSAKHFDFVEQSNMFRLPLL